MNHLKLPLLLFVLFISCFLAACSETPESPAGVREFALDTEMLTVYKSPTCGCCNTWIDHIESQGFKTNAKDVNEMGSIKQHFHVPNNLGSCHTAVSKEGFVFEGHVPARYIHQFLSKPPADAIGLTVPAMPVGSPGMEVDDKFMPYQVLLMKKDGNVEVFAEVQNQASQYQTYTQ